MYRLTTRCLGERASGVMAPPRSAVNRSTGGRGILCSCVFFFLFHFFLSRRRSTNFSGCPDKGTADPRQLSTCWNHSHRWKENVRHYRHRVFWRNETIVPTQPLSTPAATSTPRSSRIQFEESPYTEGPQRYHTIGADESLEGQGLTISTSGR